MKFAQESKFEALEEKLVKSQTECATLQRQLAAAAKKHGGQAEEIAQQMVEMRDELERLQALLRSAQAAHTADTSIDKRLVASLLVTSYA